MAAESMRSSSLDAQIYSVHYLTGACHSTPLHSHLHLPGPVHWHTWSLDCSPACRSNHDVDCQSESFAKDPVGFVGEAYFSTPTCTEEETSTDGRACHAESEKRQPPDFMVTYADYAGKLKSQLAVLGLHEAGRFSNGINGLCIGSARLGMVGPATSDEEANAVYRRISFLGDFVQLNIDEMVLFSSPTVDY